jgi:hypothetical protein
MTAAIAGTAGRAASNRITLARPDQLPPAPPGLARSAAGTAARLSGVRKPVAWTDPCGDDRNCGSLLITATSPARDSEHRSRNAAGGARAGRRAGHPVVPAGRADPRARRTSESGQVAGPDRTPLLCRTGLCGLGGRQRPGAASGKPPASRKNPSQMAGRRRKTPRETVPVVRMGQQARTG